MPRTSRSRTSRPASFAVLPDDLRLGTMLVAGLRQVGLLSLVAEWLPLSRRGGHLAQALFTFAVVFLSAGRKWGLRPFLSTYKAQLRGRIAPLLGFRSLPTAASMSRALGTLEHKQVRPFLDRLLTAELDTRRLLTSPHVRHRDAHGVGWHVLDFDPTIEAFRKRGLPTDPSLPKPQRIAPGKPGYTGHKRGETRIRHLPLQHAGSSIYLAYRLDATGGSILPLLSEVLSTGRTVLDRVSPGPTVIRADGEFGSVGAMRTCLGAGVEVLSRLSRYSLLDHQRVKSAIAAGNWRPVPGDGSGPRREAIDVGSYTLSPDSDAYNAESGPIKVRVVVSRFARYTEPDHGIVRDGFQWELFATSLSTDAWPPEHVVGLYFGRSAMENRFAQEDREIGIDRTFSYHPPGQEWMSGIGLFLWNLMVGRGAAEVPMPPRPPPQTPRETAPDGGASTAGGGSSGSSQTIGGTSVKPIQAITASTRDAAALSYEKVQDELWQIAKMALTRYPLPPRWVRDDRHRVVKCPKNKVFRIFNTEVVPAPRAGNGREAHRLRFRNQSGDCAACPPRKECSPKLSPKAFRQVTRTITASEFERVRSLLTTQRGLAMLVDPTQPPPQESAPAAARPSSKTVHPTMGPWIPCTPLFSPAASRQRLRELVLGIQVEIEVLPFRARKVKKNRLLYESEAARRHQRLSWAQREARRGFFGVATLHVRRCGGIPPGMRGRFATSFRL